ncbi:MAG: selenoneine biosynthesis selenosugar synthase SenB [Pirellulaceae bacterium]|nr:selenoneine biosynthesis selenosugar synthase SenB [Pirellulaceae bacterium]
MRILIVTPGVRGSRTGNQITALRWARILRGLRHSVAIASSYEKQACDLLIALHARKSAGTICRFRQALNSVPLIVALTGTDLYGDLGRSPAARKSIDLADYVILLQPAGIEPIPERLRAKCRVIYQSAIASSPRRPLKRSFEVVISGHLRPVKDPFRAAYAVRHLPIDSRLCITHLGAALSAEMRRRADLEMLRNTRYRWWGNVPHWRSRQLIARGRALVLSSRMEGGASVIAESIVNRTPVIASDISGNRGMLGADYPGLFACGNTLELRSMLWKVEQDVSFRNELRRRVTARLPNHSPMTEQRSWRKLISELS